MDWKVAFHMFTPDAIFWQAFKVVKSLKFNWYLQIRCKISLLVNITGMVSNQLFWIETHYYINKFVTQSQGINWNNNHVAHLFSGNDDV